MPILTSHRVDRAAVMVRESFSSEIYASLSSRCSLKDWSVRTQSQEFREITVLAYDWCCQNGTHVCTVCICPWLYLSQQYHGFEDPVICHQNMSWLWVYGFGGLEQWNVMVNGLDWNGGMEWNSRGTDVIVAVFWPLTFKLGCRRLLEQAEKGTKDCCLIFQQKRTMK